MLSERKRGENRFRSGERGPGRAPQRHRQLLFLPPWSFFFFPPLSRQLIQTRSPDTGTEAQKREKKYKQTRKKKKKKKIKTHRAFTGGVTLYGIRIFVGFGASVIFLCVWILCKKEKEGRRTRGRRRRKAHSSWPARLHSRFFFFCPGGLSVVLGGDRKPVCILIGFFFFWRGYPERTSRAAERVR